MCMEVTETEVTEQEVTRVYCDECGDECTDDHNHVKKEVCDSCTDMSTMEKINASVPRIVPASKSSVAADNRMIITAVMIYPFVFIAMIFGRLHDDLTFADGDTHLAMVHIVGTMLYTAFLGSLFLLSVLV